MNFYFLHLVFLKTFLQLKQKVFKHKVFKKYISRIVHIFFCIHIILSKMFLVLIHIF